MLHSGALPVPGQVGGGGVLVALVFLRKEDFLSLGVLILLVEWEWGGFIGHGSLHSLPCLFFSLPTVPFLLSNLSLIPAQGLNFRDSPSRTQFLEWGSPGNF